MSILITGAGMVGGLTARKVLEIGQRPILYEQHPQPDFLRTVVDLDQVSLIKGDILDLPNLLRVIKDKGIDRIIHTASLLMDAVRNNPYGAIRTNIVGTANILEAARLMNIQRVVFSSTAGIFHSVFGVPDGGTYPEDFTMKCLSTRPTSLYPVTKLAGEYMGLIYNELYGVDFAALRFAGIFGPWIGRPGGIPGMLMERLVRNAALQKPVIFDDPYLTFSGRLELLYAKDAANSAVLACFSEKLQSKVYSITMGRMHTFQEIIDTVKEVFPRIQIEVKEISKNGIGGIKHPRQYPLDLSKARAELGYEPEYDLERAVRDYADWVRRNLGQ